MAKDPSRDYADRFTRVAQALFGPGVDLGSLTEEHLKRINEHWNLHAPTPEERDMWESLKKRARGGPVKKKRGSYMGGGKVHRKEYAKGGGVRKAARYS